MTASSEEIAEGLEYGLDLHNMTTFKSIRRSGGKLEITSVNA